MKYDAIKFLSLEGGRYLALTLEELQITYVLRYTVLFYQQKLLLKYKQFIK